VIELCFREDFPCANLRATDDEVQDAVVFWRLLDLGETGFDLLCSQMPHAYNSFFSVRLTTFAKATVVKKPDTTSD